MRWPIAITCILLGIAVFDAYAITQALTHPDPVSDDYVHAKR